MGQKHSLQKSFAYAFSGLKTALRDEPNLRIHFVIATITIIAAIFFGFSILEWSILTFTIFFVIMLELLNTVLEEIVNLVSPDFRPEAKVAKDVAAAGVLLAAILAAIIGVLLFGPKILNLLFGI